jgi:hypothetical protein
MPVNESAQLEGELIDAVGLEVDGIFMNGLYPERFGPGDLERIEAAAGVADSGERDTAVVAALSAARDQARRAAGQREQLERLREMTRSPISELPFVYAPELGRDEIAWLSERIEGEEQG